MKTDQIDKQMLRELLKRGMPEDVPPTDPKGLSGNRCRRCSCELTNEEVHYFLTACTGCETLKHERIKAWRQGAHDPALDAGRFLDMPEVH